MKLVIIIAIAVVCSVVAMIGVLAVFDEIDNIEAENLRLDIIREKNQAYQENRYWCVKLHGNKLSSVYESNPYQDCLDYGIDFAVKSMLDECRKYGLDLSVAKAVCVVETIKILEEKIGYEPVEDDLSRLFDQKTIKIMQEMVRMHKPYEMIKTPYDNLSVTTYTIQYNKCLSESSEGSCKDILNDAVNNYCNEKISWLLGSPSYTYFIKCVSMTNLDIIQNYPITMESKKILECLNEYDGREDKDRICIRSWN